MEIYVKSSFKPGNAEYDGAELTYGFDAYSNLTEALRYASDFDTIVLLDKSATVKTAQLENYSSVTVIGGVADEMEGTQTSQASLTITGTTDDIPLLMESVSFKLFKSVKLVNACTGELIGGDIKDVDNINPDDGNGKWIDEYKTVGSAHIGDDAAVNGDITGFNSVTVEDDAAVYGSIAGMWDVESMSFAGSIKEEESSSGNESKWSNVTSNTYKAGGAVKVTEGFVENDILGYGTVTLKDHSYVGCDIDRGQDGSYTYKENGSSNSSGSTYSTESSTVYNATGTLTASDSHIGGNIIDYNTVTLTNTDAGEISGSGFYKSVSKYSEKSMADDCSSTAESSQEYKASGKVTLKIDAKAEQDMMTVGAIDGYANVTATGYDNGKDDEEEIERGIWIDGSIMGGESKSSEKALSNAYIYIYEDKTSAAVTLKTNIEVSGEIIGYNNVTLSDSVTVSGGVNAIVSYGAANSKLDAKDTVTYNEKNGGYSGVCSEVYTMKTAGTFKADDGVYVGASDYDNTSIVGYGTVNIKEANIAGGIIRGDDLTKTVKTTYSTKNGLVTLVAEDTTVYKASGSLTAVDSFIGGEISDYNNVTLTNVSTYAAAIIRNMAAKESLKVTAVGDDDEAANTFGMSPGDILQSGMDITAVDYTREDKAAGSVTLKIDAKAENGDTMAVGAIDGYAKVTATGFNDSKNFRAGYININGDITGGELKETDKEQAGVSEQYVDEYKASGSVTLKTNVAVNGSITGYNNVTLSDNVTVGSEFEPGSGDINATPLLVYGYDNIFGYYKEDESYKIKNDSAKRQISGTESEIETIKAAGTFKADKGVEVAGDVLGYGTVNIKDTTINGGIIRGEDNTDTEKTTYSTKNDLVTLVEEESKVYKASGSLTAVDSFIGGEISDYSKVTLTNTNVFENDSYYPGSESANIVRNTESKNSLKSTYTGTYEQASRYYNGEVFDISESGMILTSEEEIRETKAAGSVTLKIDAKAENGDTMAVGGISGYAKVTATGFNDSKNYRTGGININGDITGGELKETYKEQAGVSEQYVDEYKASGSVTLKTNVTVDGDISGYSTVTLSDSTLVTGDVTAGNITYDYLARIQTRQAAGTLKMDDGSFIYGSVREFKSVAAKESYIGGSIIGGDSSGSFRLRAVGMLSASGNLDLNETQVGWDETIAKIAGFKTVKITDSGINADIDGYETKGTAVTLDDVYLNGKITGVQQVTIKECADILNGYEGTVFDDTVTIGKNVSVDLGGGSDFVLDFGEGTKDKLVLDGIVRLHEAVDFNDIGLETVSGKGTIAATSDVYNHSVMFSGKNDITMLNLGSTIENFDGIAAEKADDTKAKAVSIDWDWDGYSNCFIGAEGWLGTGDKIDFEDNCDWLKFKAEFDGRVTVDGLGDADTIEFNGDTLYAGEQNYFDVSAGTEYKICITRNTDNSTSYYLAMEVM